MLLVGPDFVIKIMHVKKLVYIFYWQNSSNDCLQRVHSRFEEALKKRLQYVFFAFQLEETKGHW